MENNKEYEKEFKLKAVPRIYQQNIFKEIINKNSLVVIPTGLGKTFIALMLIVYKLKKEDKKVLFLAPTKPLVEQHKKSIIELSNIEEDEIYIYTGEKSKEKRIEALKSSKIKIIIATPQTIANDILSKNLTNFEDFSLIIFDEAHRATGNYDYVFIAKEFYKNHKNIQILALTASPGSDKEKIYEVLKNLYIEKIETRTFKSPDVKPYIKKIKQEWVLVDLPNEFKLVRDYFKKIAKNYYKRLKKTLEELYSKNIVIPISDFDKLNKRELLNLQKELSSNVNNIKDQSIKELLFNAIIDLNILIKLQYLIELLESQGRSAAYEYSMKIVNEGRSKKNKSAQELIKDDSFREGLILLEKLKVEHPKLDKLFELLKEELKDDDGNKKFIVFTQFRTSAKLISGFLNSKGIKAERFVGQSSRGSDKGMSQKKQIEIIEKFKNNEFKVLVATSVAEEGIDIPSVDAVIFYEPVPSEIRAIQRRGRTGRQSEGKTYILASKDTIDIAYYFSAKKKEREMMEEIENLSNLDFEIEVERKQKEKKEKDEKRLMIITDDRERNILLLEKLEENFDEVVKKRLEVGDFIISDEVVVERKTLEDFLASLLDKRIFEQIEKMKISYGKPLIIVEGSTNIEDLFNLRNIHPNAIRGLLISIMLDYKIPIFFVKNEEETANLLKIIARREQLNLNKKPQVKIVKKIKDVKEAQELLISSIPGINKQLSTNLLLYFNNPKNIANASIKELSEVPLIGKEKARKIYEVFNTNYDPNKENKIELIKEKGDTKNKEEEKKSDSSNNILKYIK